MKSNCPVLVEVRLKPGESADVSLRNAKKEILLKSISIRFHFLEPNHKRNALKDLRIDS